MLKTHTKKLAQFLFVRLRTHDLLKPEQYELGTRCNTAEARMHVAGYGVWASAFRLRFYSIGTFYC
jgi:hypothetical protein